jgi:Dolichyl-phosphate-mannose-protein mannosyltransferase
LRPRPSARPLVSVWLPVAVIIAGAAVRLWQYAGRASLFIDEAALARDIVDRPLRQLLFEPLPFDQIAPPGFLMVEKVAVTLFGNNEYALRLFPVACGILSLVLLWRVASRLMQGAAVSAAIALMAFAPGLIAYSCMVKQYSSDVAASLVLMLLALDLRQAVPSVRRACWAGVAGVVVAWFSQPAVLTLAGLGAALVALAILEPDKTAFRRALLVACLWSVSAAGAVLGTLRVVASPSARFMLASWNYGFPPRPLAPLSAAAWLWHEITSSVLDVQGFAYRWPGLYVALAVMGLAGLWRMRRDHAAIVVAPLLAALAAAAAQRYPFAGRLALFVAPSLVLAAAAAAPALGALVPRHRAIVSSVAAVLIALPAAHALRRSHPVYDPEPLASSLSHLASARRAGDRVYVYYGSAQAFLFYASRFGFAKDDYVIGGCHRSHPIDYFRELDRFRGSPRLWVVIAHANPKLEEVQAILGYLGRIGVSRDSLVVQALPADERPALGSRVDLYDLSDAARLAAMPLTSPHPPYDPRSESVGCERGPPATAWDSRAR